MINTARQFKLRDIGSQRVNFLVGDGMNLPFADGSFDLVMSGGSTAFIDDKRKALKEYTRVTKTWGFVADINFYYKQKAPEEIIGKLNSAMNINIEPWGKDYWVNLYKETELELYYTHFNDVYVPSDDEIITYCTEMSASVTANADTQRLIKERLIELMSLFTENHRYLSYGIFVLRKRNEAEQISLFGS
ncbi:methyltransferase domain-containing protein [Microcoleus sp. T2B6]|uniref:methyltransferase domain-containing protein n=1 Tax=Microcoleus sp. T2B6 TaxID=3055424 RepID=UPI002FD25EE0